MAGRLTAEQMRERARGPEFDRLSLSLMIQHHHGAVAMTEDLLRTDGAGPDAALFRFASDVEVDQSAEMAQHKRILTSFLTAGGTR